MCGGIAPIGGYQGILYDCAPAGADGFGSCTFREECTNGCRRVPPNGGTFNDFCAAGDPNPIAISRNYIVSGDRVAGTIVLEAPAGSDPTADQETASPDVLDENFNSMVFPISSFVIPDGATTGPFEVATSYVPTIEFANIQGFWFNKSIPPFLITNGRAGQTWLVKIPPNPPPAVATPALGDFFISGLNPITGGDGIMGQVDLSGLSRVGGPTFTLTSSQPSIVPTQTVAAPASEQFFGFQAFFNSNPTPTDTNVTITLSDGRYSFSDVVTVRAAPPPPPLAELTISPSSVVGGNSATGTVRLSGPQSGPTIVQVSMIEGAPATFTASNPPCPPSSVCRNVTVPAGAMSANFTINTSPVTFQFNLNVVAHLAGSPQRQALLLITPGGSLAIKNLAISPDSLVGGVSATGTVTLTGAAPAGGAVVPLSKSLSSGGTAVVPVTIPANVTVPAGQITASFAINSSSVTAATNVRVSGVFGGVTANADVTLFPLLNSVLFSGTIPGGTPAMGEVFLNGPAPSGGAVVALSSADTSLATVPPSVIVPAGKTSASFTANTSPVTQFTFVGITASYAGVTSAANLFLSVARAVASVTLTPSTVVGPASLTARVTLQSAAPQGNAFVELASSNTVLATVPFSVLVLSGQSSATFTVNTAQVITTSTVQISASYENETKSATLTINPSGEGGGGPTLSSVSLNPTSVVGGNSSSGTVTLSAAAPSGGAVVTLSDNSSSATTPASVTVSSGATSATFTVPTTTVTATTTITITGVYAGVTRTGALTVNPASSSTPGTPTLVSPADGATGIVQPITLDWNNVTNAASYEVQVDNSSTISAPFVANPIVTVSQATLPAGLPAQQLWWRVRARNAAGTFGSFSSTRRFTPQGAPAPASLSAVSVSPTSVVGGNSSTGTATLTSAAPVGGAVVSLSSAGTAVTVPANVTVAGGATSATFTATTAAVSGATPVTISAVYSGVTRTATLTVNPAGGQTTATLSVTATGRGGERVTSSPVGINVPVGSTGSAVFNTGASITLSVSNGRDAIWSGACSSGGNKTRTCTFTLNGNAAVTANVQ